MSTEMKCQRCGATVTHSGSDKLVRSILKMQMWDLERSLCPDCARYHDVYLKFQTPVEEGTTPSATKPYTVDLGGFCGTEDLVVLKDPKHSKKLRTQQK